MPKFSTNNLLDKEEKKSRYAGLLVDQLDVKKENEFASNVSSLKEERRLRCQKIKLRTFWEKREEKRRKTAPLPDQIIGAFPEHNERK